MIGNCLLSTIPKDYGRALPGDNPEAHGLQQSFDLVYVVVNEGDGLAMGGYLRLHQCQEVVLVHSQATPYVLPRGPIHIGTKQDHGTG